MCVMSTSLTECEQTVKRLTPAERATLMEHLISSLDAPDEMECERPWLAEAERRYADYQAGRVTARPADEVIRDIRAGLTSLK